MTDEEKKFLRDKFHFPLRLVYPRHLIRPSKLNRRADQPASMSFPLRSIVYNEDGETEEWRWANNSTLDTNNRPRYFPRRFNFMGNTVLQETQLEMLYYLYWKCPHCHNGGLPADQRKTAMFAIEDLVAIAKEKVSQRADKARYDVMLYDRQLGLPEHRLRSLAKAYFIPKVDDLDIDQVRVAIDFEVQRDRRGGMENFFELSDSEEYVKMRSKLQMAIDSDIVTYLARERVWAWRGDPDQGEKKRKEDICRVLSKADPKQALIDWYENNADFRERLKYELEDLSGMEPEDPRAPVESTAGPAKR